MHACMLTRAHTLIRICTHEHRHSSVVFKSDRSVNFETAIGADLKLGNSLLRVDVLKLRLEGYAALALHKTKTIRFELIF